MKTVWIALATAIACVLLFDLIGYGGEGWLCNWGTYIIGLILIFILFTIKKERIKTLIAQIIAFSMISFVIFTIGIWHRYELRNEFYKPCWSGDGNMIAFGATQKIYRSNPGFFSPHDSEEVASNNYICIYNIKTNKFEQTLVGFMPIFTNWVGGDEVISCYKNKMYLISGGKIIREESLGEEGKTADYVWLSVDKRYLGYAYNYVHNYIPKGETLSKQETKGILFVKDISKGKEVIKKEVDYAGSLKGAYNKDLIAYYYGDTLEFINLYKDKEETTSFKGISSQTFYSWNGEGDCLNGVNVNIGIDGRVNNNLTYYMHDGAVSPNRGKLAEPGGAINIYDKNENLEMTIKPNIRESYLFNVISRNSISLEVIKHKRNINGSNKLRIVLLCWSPDSEKIAFIADATREFGLRVFPRWLLCTIDYTGENFKILKELSVNNNRSYNIAWSGSGSIIYSISSHRGNKSEIFKINPDKPGFDKILSISNSSHAYNIWLSKDERYLAYLPENGIYSIVDLKEKKTIFERKNINAIWGSYNNNKIAFYDKENLMVFDIDNNQITSFDMSRYKVKDIGLPPFQGWDPTGKCLMGKYYEFNVEEQWVIPGSGDILYDNHITYRGQYLSPNEAKIAAVLYNGSDGLIITDRSCKVLFGKKAFSKYSEKNFTESEFKEQFKTH